jgi:hypothetical protein
MKKRVLMGFVLLAIIGTSTVFAQQPTLDKLKFGAYGQGYQVNAVNKQISGAVVIPDTYNGKSVVSVYDFRDCQGITSVTIPNSVTAIEASAFQRCTGIKSITIPASVTKYAFNSFNGCTNLTSVTFQGGTATNLERTGANATFPGDLGTKYQAGGAGTYTRQAGSNTWTKEGGFSLNGTWTRSDGAQITISGDGGQTLTIAGTAPNNGGRFSRNFSER